jgi:hypothetical protein
MAQADSVPIAVRAPITGVTAKTSTKPRPADWLYFIGGWTPGSFMADHEPALPRLWQDMRAEVERESFPLGVVTQDPTRGWYEAITCRMPSGWHVMAVCYATVAILLGWWPWNFLLLLLLFPIANELVRFHAFPTVAAKESMRRRESYGRGSPT